MMKSTGNRNFIGLSNEGDFELWYYKLVTGDEGDVVCLVPGRGSLGLEEEAFVQVIWAHRLGDRWEINRDGVRFTLENASLKEAPFQLTMGDQVFTAQGMHLEGLGQTLQLSGEVLWDKGVTAPKRLWSQASMGPFNYLPGLSCRHSILAVDLDLRGELWLEGQRLDFYGGRGYWDKSWGSGLPEEYIFLQSNHLGEAGNLVFYWASLSIGPLAFKGFDCRLYYDGDYYHFSTYTWAKCEIKHLKRDAATIELENDQYKLTLAVRDRSFGKTVAPWRYGLGTQAKEGRMGDLYFRLKKKEEGRILEGGSKVCSMEIRPLMEGIKVRESLGRYQGIISGGWGPSLDVIRKE